MSTRRIIVLVVDDTDAAEDLRTAITSVETPPWKPIPAGENHATYQQERWSQEDTDRLILERLKRAAPKVHWTGSLIVPSEVTT